MASQPHTGHKFSTLDDVLKLFPDSMRPTRAKLEEAAEESGCYHDVWGKKGFTQQDIEDLFDYLHATPKAPAEIAKLGPGRLFNQDLPKNTPGYMVFIGDQLGEDKTVFVGFAPDKSAGDLLRLVQFGNPGNLAILHFFPATVADVNAHRFALKRWQYRSDDTNWFMRSKVVDAYILKLRDDLYGKQDVVDEADEGNITGDE